MAEKKENKQEATEESLILSGQQMPSKYEDFKDLQSMKVWAEMMIDGGLIPSSISEPESVITIVAMGNELGLKPMVALQNLHVISGRPTISSSMMGSLLHRSGIEFKLVDNYKPLKNKEGKVFDYRTTYKFFSKSDLIEGLILEQDFSITWRQMKTAGYTEKENWQKYPQEMMRARCISYASRALFPWVISGMYTELEINDIASREGFQEMDVTMNEEGELEIQVDATRSDD